MISYRHADLADAQKALQRVGVPGVIAGGGSVFATPAATEWLTLLEALDQPHRSTRVRSAALTCFFGHTAVQLDERGDDLTDDVADTLRSWLELFATRGLAAVLESATVAGLPARVLGEHGGERRLTDLRHIGEVLHEVTLAQFVTQHHGLVSLLTWLREQVAEGRAGRGLERTRRLDSDAAAVQLVTIHASKGLEYPVVYLPAVSDRHVSEPELPRFHDDEGRRCRNVGAGGPGWADHVRRAQEEDAGEWLRLLYVALTRAQSQVVCWWSPTKNTIASPLHRMLMRPDVDVGVDVGVDEGAEVPREPGVPSDDEAIALFARWRDRGGPTPEPARPAELTGPGPAADVHALGVRSFTRTVDAAWRRTSYSSLSAVRARGGRAGRGQRAGGRRQGRRGAGARLPLRGFRDGRCATSSNQRRRLTSPRRWPASPSGRRSGRSCTPSSSTPTRRPTTSGPSCSPTSTSSVAGGRSRSTVRSSPTRWSRCVTRRSADPPRCCRGSPCGASH